MLACSGKGGGKNMVITQFTADNFKRLKAVRIHPDGTKLITVSGKNNQGKSSVLDAIAAAIGGLDHVPRVPVRVGAKEARLFVDLGDLRITRVIQPDRSATLVVEHRDGTRPRTPQKVLDELAGQLTLDPMEFMNLKASERIDALKKLIPAFDFVGNAKARQDAYDRRTEVGRDFKRVKANLDMLPPPPETRPEPIDVGKAIEERSAQAAEAQMLRTRMADDILRLERDIDELRKQVRFRTEDLMRLQEKYDTLPDIEEPGDPEPLRQVIAQAQTIDRDIQRYDRYTELSKDIETSQQELRRLDEVIEDLDDCRRLAVRNAQLPVEGLGFGETDVTIDNLPFEQASSSMQLTTATAITMALRPTLKVILVRQGPLLDAEHLLLLSQIAEQRGYQVWCERLDENTKTGVIIEDGEVVQ
jgi:archaellum component FlaC